MQVYACVDWLKSNAVKLLSTPTKRDADHDVYDATAAVIERVEPRGSKQSSGTGDESLKHEHGGAAAAASATATGVGATGVGATGGPSISGAAAAPKRKNKGAPVRVRRRGKAIPPRRNNTCGHQATVASPARRIGRLRAQQQQFMRHLMRYDKLLEKERFDIHDHECDSCLDEKPGRFCVIDAFKTSSIHQSRLTSHCVFFRTYSSTYDRDTYLTIQVQRCLALLPKHSTQNVHVTI